MTFTSGTRLYNGKKETYSKESHATLKSKLQIQLKMNVYEEKKNKPTQKGQVRLRFNQANHKGLFFFWSGEGTRALVASYDSSQNVPRVGDAACPPARPRSGQGMNPLRRCPHRGGTRGAQLTQCALRGIALFLVTPGGAGPYEIFGKKRVICRRTTLRSLCLTETKVELNLCAEKLTTPSPPPNELTKKKNKPNPFEMDF